MKNKGDTCIQRKTKDLYLNENTIWAEGAIAASKANITIALVRECVKAEGGNTALHVTLARPYLQSRVFGSGDTMWVRGMWTMRGVLW